MWLTDGYISSPHTATNLLLLQLSALLLPGEEAPQVPVGVLQQGRHAVCLLSLLRPWSHVSCTAPRWGRRGGARSPEAASLCFRSATERSLFS